MKPVVFGLCLIFCSYFAAAQYDYSLALEDALLFYEAQRSGKLPSTNRVPWRGDSALNDKGINGEDLTGGYYDAGDHVKFHFPMAFSLTIIGWSMLTHLDGYELAGQTEYGYDTLRWGLDYLIKCHISEHELYGQVGNGTLDHNYWGRPEDMTMERPAFKIDEANPGSDLAGEVAAAFAAASLVFQDVDADYAADLKQRAIQLYEFADNFRGKYSDSIPDAANFYGSYGYEDELLWSSVWMYKATNDETYLTKAEDLFNQIGNFQSGGFGWDNKIAGAQILLYQVTNKDVYKNLISGMCDYLLNEAPRTPKGLIFLGEGGSIRNILGPAVICLQAAEAGINPEDNIQLLKSQIDYALGDGGRSYVVGFGENYPKYAHHRAASCPDPPTECGWNFFNSNTPDAHIIYGGLVGGPRTNDTYTDTRLDAGENEVACDFNAVFTGGLAGLLVQLRKEGKL